MPYSESKEISQDKAIAVNRKAIADGAVEAGSNANGRYWKYPDGRLTCIRSYSQVWAVGNNVVSITLPETYLNSSSMVPNISWGASTTGWTKAGIQPNGPGAVTVTIVMTSAATRTIYIQTEGIWK